MKAFSCRTLMFAVAFSAAQVTANAQEMTCYVGRNDDPSPNSRIAVSVEAASNRIRTGDAIAVKWKSALDQSPKCRTPLYLVLATPLRTRFEAARVLALPPGASAPFGIAYRSDQTRIFIPLHFGKDEYEGELSMKVFEAWQLHLDWALVEVPKWLPKSAKPARTSLWEKNG